MPPRPVPYSPSRPQRLRWWLVVGLVAFLAASATSWVGAALPASRSFARQTMAPGTHSAASRSNSAPAPLPSRLLDVDGDSVPDLVLPAPAITLTTRPAVMRRVRTTTAAIPYGRQVAPLPLPPRVIG